MGDKLTHLDEKGNALMVDVTEKSETFRVATASGTIVVSEEIIKLIQQGEMKKGDVIQVARIAGIMAAKSTSNIIPLCHPLQINGCKVDFEIDSSNCEINIFSEVKVTGKTGVEMEALTAVSAAALTIYDMCKAVDKEMVIKDIHLVEKKGGKSGDFVNSRQGVNKSEG